MISVRVVDCMQQLGGYFGDPKDAPVDPASFWVDRWVFPKIGVPRNHLF